MLKLSVLTAFVLALTANSQAAPPADPMSVKEPVTLADGSLPKISSMDLLNLLKKRIAELKIIEDAVKNQIKNGLDPFGPIAKDYIASIFAIDAKLKKIQKEYPSAAQADKDLMIMRIMEIKTEMKILEDKITNPQPKSKL